MMTSFIWYLNKPKEVYLHQLIILF